MYLYLLKANYNDRDPCKNNLQCLSICVLIWQANKENKMKYVHYKLPTRNLIYLLNQLGIPN